MKSSLRGKDRRTENRCAFIGDIPGRLVHQSNELKFLAVDVSRKGLGIHLDPCPAEGEEITVEFKNKARRPLRFTVKHIYEGASVKGKDDSEMQRCGIELIPGQSSDIDLLEIFSRY